MKASLNLLEYLNGQVRIPNIPQKGKNGSPNK